MKRFGTYTVELAADTKWTDEGRDMQSSQGEFFIAIT